METSCDALSMMYNRFLGPLEVCYSQTTQLVADTMNFDGVFQGPSHVDEVLVTDHDLVALLVRCATRADGEGASNEVAQVTVIDHLRSPHPYDGLVTRHRMGVYSAVEEGCWWSPLVISQMPTQRGDKPTKRQATWEDLEFLLQKPVASFCEDFGLLEIGTKGLLLGIDDRNRNSLVAKFPAESAVAAIGVYCLTRPLSLYRHLR